ncbi:MAG: response regulator transcription factor [Oscillospiraceae bacterium]|nr:response regulator transcription factor [Oscillospiraceae bacterium]
MIYQVLIADDYRMIRETFSSILNSRQNAEIQYNISGMAENAAQAIEHCKENHVDLVLMDVVMGSGKDGIEAARAIKEISPDTKILLVTSMPEVSFIERAKEAGIDSFWHKELQEQPLLDVMDRTMRGESIYPTQMPEVFFGNTVSTNLTAREMQVLHCLVGGASNSEISEKLGISERVVKQHITDMLTKTGFKSRLQLAVRARGGGLVINDSDAE